ncbi:hypothetical protein PO124_22315 [Bacillus licheniformis]|nr:hypothetical protein [Bacillus licheniformis]
MLPLEAKMGPYFSRLSGLVFDAAVSSGRRGPRFGAAVFEASGKGFPRTSSC